MTARRTPLATISTGADALVASGLSERAPKRKSGVIETRLIAEVSIERSTVSLGSSGGAAVKRP